MKRELTIIIFIAFSVFSCKDKSENKAVEPTINIEKQEKIDHIEHAH